MEEKSVIHLNKFQPRSYQLPILDALENKGYKRVISILPRRCISGRAQILLSNGMYCRMKDIKRGDKILAWDGAAFVEDTVAEVWATGEKESMITRSAGYQSVTTSPEHLFLTADGWVPAQHLSGKSVLQYSGLPGTLHEPHLAELYGYLVAIPPYAHNAYVKISHASRDILERIESLINDIVPNLSTEPSWRESAGTFSLVYQAPPKRLVALFSKCIKNSNSFIPEEVFQFDNTSVDIFLGGYASANGRILKDNNILNISLLLPGKESLSNIFYWLLRKRGILSTPPMLGDDNCWYIYLSDPLVVKTIFSLTIVCKGQKRVPRLARELSLIPDGVITQGGIKTCVVSQNRHVPEEMYDLRTERYGNFVANGYVVHNSGKDITAFNVAIRQCLRKPCVVYYIFPTYAQGKKILWDSITNEGMRILEYIPPEVVKSQNTQEMKIRFINGSLFQIVGSDNYNSLVGTNPQGVVFSEYALQDPRAYQFIRPILTANDGWALFISTPRGKNHLWDLYNIAQQSPLWFAQKLTVEDTKHIPLELIEQERAEGIMSEDLIQQEYYTSFTMGVEGSYYAKYLDRMRISGNISEVPWNPSYEVHTAWDLGVRDATAIIFFQVIGMTVCIIDCYDNTKQGLEHYVKVVREKPYIYGKHIAPHDIQVREFGTGITRIDKARQLGITFVVTPRLSIEDGIEAVRSALGCKVYVDEIKCLKLLKALENYRQEYDIRNKVYRGHPLHDWSSNYADAMRYLCISIPKAQSNKTTPEELEKRYQETVYGNKDNMPAFFRNYHE